MVESNLEIKMKEMSHAIDDYFTVADFGIVQHKKTEVADVTEKVVYCSNLEGFIQFVKEKRALSNPDSKFGIDGGKDFLKICLSI